MLSLATSAAVSKDIGLIATFGGIGLIVNIIVVYIAIQIRGERRQNREYIGLPPTPERLIRLTTVRPRARRRSAPPLPTARPELHPAARASSRARALR